MINVGLPEHIALRPRITVLGLGGAGGNAVNNMLRSGLEGVEFVVANTDAQALDNSMCENRIQLGMSLTRGLGAGASPEVGHMAAKESISELLEYVSGSNMIFITAGMGGGTGTGAGPIVAKYIKKIRESGDDGDDALNHPGVADDVLVIGVVTRPFDFEGPRRMRVAELGIEKMQRYVDTLIVLPNQYLFRVINDKTTVQDAFKHSDAFLTDAVHETTSLITKPGLINLDFADIRTVMSEKGKAMIGIGTASGEGRAVVAAESAISNPLLDNSSMKGARGVLINVRGGSDITLFEIDAAANRIRDEVDPDANIIFGSTFDVDADGEVTVSVVATGIDDSVDRCASQELNSSSREAERKVRLGVASDLAKVMTTADGECVSDVSGGVGSSSAQGFFSSRAIMDPDDDTEIDSAGLGSDDRVDGSDGSSSDDLVDSASSRDRRSSRRSGTEDSILDIPAFLRRNKT